LREDVLRRTSALLCHLLLLVAALRWSHSVSGFLLNGPALALLLDRYLFRVLPWAVPVNWPREAALRGAYFLLWTSLFYLMRPGIVPWWEASYRGAGVCVAAFALDSFIGLVSRSRAAGIWLRGVILGLLVLLIPVTAALHPLHTVPKRTPAALGLAFEDIRIRTADGLRLTAWVVPHAEARGNVIFCHGHGRNRGHVAGLLPALHGLRLNVLAFDFRGHGDSEGHTSVFGKQQVNDLLAAEAYLSERFPGQPLFLIGISLGAAVSLQALPYLPNVRGVWSEGAFARLEVPVEHEFRLLPGWVRKPLVAAYRWIAGCGCRGSTRWTPSPGPALPSTSAMGERTNWSRVRKVKPCTRLTPVRSGTGGSRTPITTTSGNGTRRSICIGYGRFSRIG
jgi:Serine aminopeptidase, S33